MKILFMGDIFLGGDLMCDSSRLEINSALFWQSGIKIANFEQPISNNSIIVVKIHFAYKFLRHSVVKKIEYFCCEYCQQSYSG